MKTIALVLLTLGADDKGDSLKALSAAEAKTWEAYKKKDAAAVKELIADDFAAVYDSGGQGDRASMLEDMKKTTLTAYKIEDAKVHPLTKDAAVLTYRLTYTAAEGKAGPETKTLRASSTWVRRGGKWVNVYYQETPLKKR